MKLNNAYDQHKPVQQFSNNLKKQRNLQQSAKTLKDFIKSQNAVVHVPKSGTRPTNSTPPPPRNATFYQQPGNTRKQLEPAAVDAEFVTPTQPRKKKTTFYQQPSDSDYTPYTPVPPKSQNKLPPKSQNKLPPKSQNKLPGYKRNVMNQDLIPDHLKYQRNSNLSDAMDKARRAQDPNSFKNIMIKKYTDRDYWHKDIKPVLGAIANTMKY